MTTNPRAPYKTQSGICHKTVYERASALRRIAGSSIYKRAEYCVRCDGWHLAR